jgi:hypothetical protein
MSLMSAAPKIAAIWTLLTSTHPLLLFFTVATYIADIITIRCYCSMITFILKRTQRLHLDSVLDVPHMHRKVMR